MSLLAVVLIATSAWVQDEPARPEPPYVCMYGFGDTSLPLWADTLSHVNIVTGATESAELVKELRGRGIVFAYHVTNTETEERKTAEDFVDHWSAPFDNDLGGALPGGFDAISIDEFHSAPDGSPAATRTATALRALRASYPDKLIYGWGVWKLADGGPNSRYNKGKTFDEQLEAINECCDLFMLECYTREGNPQFYLFERFAKNLESRVPELLKKTIFGLYITQSEPFIADDDCKYDFKDFLDEQFHLIRNSEVCAPMPGIAFWPFYRAKADTRAHVNELIRHYYLDGETDYYGDGDYKQLVRDPSFESDIEAWELVAPEGTEAHVATYEQAEIPDKHGAAPHGVRCLRMRPGRGMCRAEQRLALKPGAHYTLSAYFRLGEGSPECRAWLGARPAGSEAMLDGQWDAHELAKNDGWTLAVHTFQAPEESGEVTIVLGASEGEQSTQVYWDFVEIEECRGMNRPTAIWGVERMAGGELRAGSRVRLWGENFVPGCEVIVGDVAGEDMTWVSSSSLELTLPPGLTAGQSEITVTKPRWCLHPHVARFEIRLSR